MNIVFVGDQPSRTNTYKWRAFEGAACWPRFKLWLHSLGLNPDDCHMINSNRPAHKKILKAASEKDFIMVAVGNEASRRLTLWDISHYKLPHPSGSNLQINNKDFINRKLSECKEYINGRQRLGSQS